MESIKVREEILKVFRGNEFQLFYAQFMLRVGAFENFSEACTQIRVTEKILSSKRTRVQFFYKDLIRQPTRFVFPSILITQSVLMLYLHPRSTL